jgi:hypothetical protein
MLEPFAAAARAAQLAESRQRILAIDPGSEQSAWITYDPALGHPGDWGKVPNEQLLADLRGGRGWGPRIWVSGVNDLVVIEFTAPRGMPASAQLFETLWWAGRFAEACRPVRVERQQRDEVKQHLLGKRAGTDAMIRAALIDRFGGIGGKERAIGRKAAPGPLYGLHADCWAALAVAVTWSDLEAIREATR